MPLVFGFFLWFSAIAPFTERGTTDFDTFLDLLDPWGSWTEAAPNGWTYRPAAAADAVPFTHGRWAYTDFGWTWIGAFPGSWATDHYGSWVLGDGGWAWRPDPNWHPATVEFRKTKDDIGWRPSRLNAIHELTEKEDVRYAKPEEWIWVPRAKFGQPITLADVVTGPAAKSLLEDSEPLSHVFTSWREIERPGPAPEDFLPKDRIVPEEARKENQPPVRADVILTLPTFWTPLPAKPEPDAFYLYRPMVYQDADGIQRRVRKWYHPAATAEEQQQLDAVLKGKAKP